MGCVVQDRQPECMVVLNFLAGQLLLAQEGCLLLAQEGRCGIALGVLKRHPCGLTLLLKVLYYTFWQASYVCSLISYLQSYGCRLKKKKK